MKVKLPQNRWFGDTPIEIDLPADWETHVAEMRGDELSPLSFARIAEALERPVGSPAIRELVNGKERACILFDDMSRGTPCGDIAQAVLKQLSDGGIEKDRITFICATGAHGALEMDDFVKKLGADIVAEYPVYSHNPFGEGVLVGTTTRNTKVMINSEVMKYDLKIAIGGIVPHPLVGYGGGCKIILPGVAMIETIHQSHIFSFDEVLLKTDRPFTDNLGNLSISKFREESEEAAMMAGLNFKIDAISNTSSQIVDISCGHPVAQYYEAVKRAAHIYSTDRFEPADVAVLNANSKSNEAFVAISIGMDYIKDGGDLVLINFCPTGIVNHYLLGMWGMDTGGALSDGNKDKVGLPGKIRRLIIYSPYKQFNSTVYYGRTDQVFWADSWKKVLDLLGRKNKDIKAVVLKEALMELFDEPFKKEYTPVNMSNTNSDDNNRANPV